MIIWLSWWHMARTMFNTWSDFIQKGIWHQIMSLSQKIQSSTQHFLIIAVFLQAEMDVENFTIPEYMTFGTPQVKAKTVEFVKLKNCRFFKVCFCISLRFRNTKKQQKPCVFIETNADRGNLCIFTDVHCWTSIKCRSSVLPLHCQGGGSQDDGHILWLPWLQQWWWSW